jgi:hypothetical protein
VSVVNVAVRVYAVQWCVAMYMYCLLNNSTCFTHLLTHLLTYLLIHVLTYSPSSCITCVSQLQDLSAGVAVFVLLIPQGLAYALLGGE